jgi:hypothetical protein
MSNGAEMTSKRKAVLPEASFSEIAKQEFALSAMAFFAPIVGTVNVMRSLLKGTGEIPPAPTTRVDAELPVRRKRAA